MGSTLSMEYRVVEAFNVIFIITMCIGVIGRVVIFIIKDLTEYWYKKDKKKEEKDKKVLA